MDNIANSKQNEIGTASGSNNIDQKQEKLFTQDEVNRIVGERLARVKTEVSPGLQERDRALTEREMLLDARERLMEAGLPKELISAINCRTKEDMENSIKVIQRLYGNAGVHEKPVYRVSGGIYGNSNGSGHRSGVDDPASIRKAMGLKG